MTEGFRFFHFYSGEIGTAGRVACSRLGMFEERAFVSLLLSGDSRAWRELDDVHGPPTKRVIRRVLARFGGLVSSADVDDAYAELCAALVTHAGHKLRQFDPERGTFRVWMGKVASRVAHDHVRRLRRNHRETLAEVGILVHSTDPIGGAMRCEHACILASVMERLPDDERELIRLELFEDTERETLAKKLRITPRALSSRKRRVLARLRRILQSEAA